MGNVLKVIYPTVPKSNQETYHFDPKIINPIGAVKFEPSRTRFRVSKEEFFYLRDKVIQNGGSYIKIAQALWFVRQFLLIVWFAILIWRIVALCVDTDNDTGNLVLQLFLYILGILVLFIIARLVGDYYAKQGCKQIKNFLAQQNNVLYNKRGLTWRINPTCVFMQLCMDEEHRGSLYTPPSTQAYQILADQERSDGMGDSSDKLN